MSIYYFYSTGRPSYIVPLIRRRVSAFTRLCKVRNFKIGVTNFPERRWRECYRGSYDEMLVVYQSTSSRHVFALENQLIDHNREYCDNLIAGGGGGTAKSGPYYLYVVVKYY